MSVVQQPTGTGNATAAAERRAADCHVRLLIVAQTATGRTTSALLASSVLACLLPANNSRQSLLSMSHVAA